MYSNGLIPIKTNIGFEINHQIKIPSNQIIRSYLQIPVKNLKRLTIYNRDYRCRGSFMIYLTKDPRTCHGYRTEARFSIALHKRDLIVLEQIKAYFWAVIFIAKERIHISTL